MKKLMVLIISSVILLSWVSSGYAAELLGYSIVPKQAKFYTSILGVMGDFRSDDLRTIFFPMGGGLKKEEEGKDGETCFY